MDYENPLDHLIHRFQHRWETNPQFRAAMSGVLGLSLIIFLCVGVAGVNAAATRVLGAVGFGSSGGGQGNIDPGGQIVNGNWTFYTPTVPDWKGGATPGSSPINNSQTPQPSPTPTATPPDAPTATPCRGGNCGGGGGARRRHSDTAFALRVAQRGRGNVTYTLHRTPDNPSALTAECRSWRHSSGPTYLDEHGQTTRWQWGLYFIIPAGSACWHVSCQSSILMSVQTIWPTHKDSILLRCHAHRAMLGAQSKRLAWRTIRPIGRRTVKTLPCPGVLSTETVPSWPSTMMRTMARPSPCPAACPCCASAPAW